MTSKSIVLYYIGQNVSLREIAEEVKEQLQSYNYTIVTELYIGKIQFKNPYILILNPYMFEGVASSLNQDVDLAVKARVKKLTKGYEPDLIHKVEDIDKKENVRIVCEKLTKKRDPKTKNKRFWETF